MTSYEDARSDAICHLDRLGDLLHPESQFFEATAAQVHASLAIAAAINGIARRLAHDDDLTDPPVDTNLFAGFTAGVETVCRMVGTKYPLCQTVCSPCIYPTPERI